jgi:hypothetical protein
MTKMFAALAFLAFLTTPALGEAKCAPPFFPRDDMLGKLTGKKYQEAPVAKALTNKGQTMLEIFANQKTGTYTIVLSTPTGCSTITSAGKFWELQPATIPGQDS